MADETPPLYALCAENQAYRLTGATSSVCLLTSEISTCFKPVLLPACQAHWEHRGRNSKLEEGQRP